jgi:NO-binding membrane sensor protein with MHYT domain
LPNSIYDGQNDELIATALGFTAHLVSMLAYYLEIPLRYPTVPMGSRAIIKDQVSLINGSRE